MTAPSQVVIDAHTSLPTQRVPDEVLTSIASAEPSQTATHTLPKESEVAVTEVELQRMLIDLSNGVKPKTPTEVHRRLRDRLVEELVVIQKAKGGVDLSSALPDA